MPIILALLRNYKLVGAGIAFLAVFGAGWYVGGNIAETTLKSALLEQESLLKGQCADDKAKTERIDNEHQAKITDLSRRVAEYRRMHKTSCVSVASATSGDNGKAGSGLVGTHDVDSGELIDYAQLAETYRLRLVSCQNFIRLERLP